MAICVCRTEVNKDARRAAQCRCHMMKIAVGTWPPLSAWTVELNPMTLHAPELLHQVITVRGLHRKMVVGSDTWDGKGQADVVEAATGGAAEAGGIVAALLVG